uniref:ATP-dependent DNA helicase n=1 Tax=Octopus bimaculoides TaxID=37653 RepID=A0A0L8H128_OCTBM
MQLDPSVYQKQHNWTHLYSSPLASIYDSYFMSLRDQPPLTTFAQWTATYVALSKTTAPNGNFWIQTINIIRHSKRPLCVILCTSSNTFFAMMLIFCNLTEAYSLWNKYKDSMCHDILLQIRQITGIASTLLNSVQTPHSTFKLPFNVVHQENPMCYIMHSLDEATILKKYKLIVLDEATMSCKCSLQVLDITMRDLRSNNNILGGATLLLAGDFQQILLIIPKETPADELNTSLKNSLLWLHVQLKQFTINMRSSLQTGQPKTQFWEMLAMDKLCMTTLTLLPLVTVSSFDDLCSAIYPNLTTEYIKPDWLRNRPVLAPTNAAVNTFNYKILNRRIMLII